MSLCVALWTVAAHATPAPAELEVLYQAAVQDVQNDTPAAALSKFESLIGVLPEDHPLFPGTVYGAGRAAALLAAAGSGDTKAACKASDLYTRYSGLPASEAGKRQKALKALPGLLAQCQASTATAPATAPAVAESVTPPAPASAAPETPPAALAAEPPAYAAASGDAWRQPVGWTGIALGGVALGLGGYFMSQAVDARDEATRPQPRAGFDADVSRMETANTRGVGLLGAGLAAAAAGVLVWVWPTE
jgi:hypothetical protein